MGEASSETDTNSGPSAWDCADDPAEGLKRMFVDVVQKRRIDLGQDPAQRPVFLKPHGVVAGRFEVRQDLPEDLKVGVFTQAELPAWVRFSSDTLPTLPDLKATCGIGIKLFGVPGPKLLGDGSTHDFILQNYDIFFVDTAADMCEFTTAGVIGGNYEPYLRTHPVTARILKAMEKVESSVLTTTYWSVLPYAFGAGRYLKYKLEPEQAADGPPPDNADYLALDLARRLRGGEARFRFMLQFRTDPDTMPLDRATVRWEESASPPIHVATLVLPRQDVTSRGQAAYGEHLAFNPWHALADHAPQGSLSDARRMVYASSAAQRQAANGLPDQEPAVPRSIASPELQDARVVRAAIHPSIGVARVGNSQEEYFLGPEVANPLREPQGFYRDATGALKRQAVRFRIYGLNAEGRAVVELTRRNADIEWTVHLANKKAAWFQFQIALDIPEATSAPPSLLRNPRVSDRSGLVIDPGPHNISGANAGGKSHAFDSGAFMGNPVYLDELRTDDAGRLVVLGGHGVSASYTGARANTFANNDGWHDDTADGPVTATVQYGGHKLEVDPAWVVVTPPNYAPRQKSVRTMWDLMFDVAIQANLLPAPVRPSFNRDIRPIFERLSHLQWVNAGYASAFGWAGPDSFGTRNWLLRLYNGGGQYQELRRTLANQFRVFARDAWSPQPWPWQYGDAMNIPPAMTPRQNASLTATQLAMLQQWADGDFDEDYGSEGEPPRSVDEVPIADQPAMLDRASLDFCLADAFHPGCEMTWPMRHASMYMAAFRLAHAAPDWLEPDYGEALGQDSLALANGPLGPQTPGGISRWMAVPWQTDTASCRSGYMPSYDPYTPTFWPAHVPNQVLTRADYEVVMDTGRPLDERLAAFASRAVWTRGLGSKSYADEINNMIAHFGRLGVIEPRDGPGDSHFPAVLQVEEMQREVEAAANAAAREAVRLDLTGIEKVRRFPRGLRQ